LLSKAKDPKDTKSSKPPAEKNEKGSSSAVSNKSCSVRGKFGHIARECRLRKTPAAADVALLVSNLMPDLDDDGHDQYLGDIVEEAAYIAIEETVLLSINNVVGSTVHLIKNPKLLTKIQPRTSRLSSTVFNLMPQEYKSAWEKNLEIMGLFITVRRHPRMFYLRQGWSTQVQTSSMITRLTELQFNLRVAPQSIVSADVRSQGTTASSMYAIWIRWCQLFLPNIEYRKTCLSQQSPTIWRSTKKEEST
jgi:hypothetical protein